MSISESWIVDVSDNAPVTKAFVITSALFTVFFGIQGRSSKLGLSYQVFAFGVLCCEFFLLVLRILGIYFRICCVNLGSDSLSDLFDFDILEQ